MSSSSSSSSSGLSSQQPDHLSPTDQLCYLNCNFCFTVLAVSVPCSSLFKTVTIRCGHCSNILTANIIPSSPPNHLHLPPHSNFFTPQNLLEEIRSSPPTMLINHPSAAAPDYSVMQFRGGIIDHVPIHHPPPLVINRPPEKRQRVPSAYNRFIKEEIQRIKAGNPDISHREAFSAAAKNWAHFPHIHFGLMPPPPDQSVKKPTMCQQEGEDLIMRKDGLFAPANLGVSPY